MEVNKGVVGTLCGAVNDGMWLRLQGKVELTRLICKEGQIGLFFCLYAGKSNRRVAGKL